jgi:hypothetical protein
MSCESCGEKCACSSDSDLETSNVIRALHYENEAVIDRYIRKLGLSRRKARILFMEVKRFLCLHALADGPISPPLKVDEGWHHFILFTEDYKEFCEEFFGAFIHHRPRRPNDPPDDGSAKKRTIDSLWEHYRKRPVGIWKFQEKRECGT